MGVLCYLLVNLETGGLGFISARTSSFLACCISGLEAALFYSLAVSGRFWRFWGSVSPSKLAVWGPVPIGIRT